VTVVSSLTRADEMQSSQVGTTSPLSKVLSHGPSGLRRAEIPHVLIQPHGSATEIDVFVNDDAFVRLWVPEDGTAYAGHDQGEGSKSKGALETMPHLISIGPKPAPPVLVRPDAPVLASSLLWSFQRPLLRPRPLTK
jgi:hypothetical protein